MLRRDLYPAEKAVITAIQAVSIVGWIVFIFVTFGQVIARYVFEIPFPWAEELARFTLIWFSFLCSIELAILDEHIDIDVFVPTGGLGTLFNVVKLLSIAGTGYLLAWGTWKLLPVVSVSHLPATGLPLSSLYAAATLAGVAFIVIATIRLVALAIDGFRTRAAA